MRSRILAVLTAFLALPIAQAQTFGPATVRHAALNDPRSASILVTPDLSLHAKSVDVLTLISYAYDVPSNPSPRLIHLPQWAIDDRFDIDAEPPSSGIVDKAGNPGYLMQQRLKEMLRHLLAQQFGLVLRKESRRMPVYELTATAGKPLLKPSTANCVLDTATNCHSFPVGFGHPLVSSAASMDGLAAYLENWTDLPVINSTQTHNPYILNASGWQPMNLPPPPPGGGNVDFTALPPLASVLKPLGLELRHAEAMVPIYTVISIVRPGPGQQSHRP